MNIQSKNQFERFSALKQIGFNPKKILDIGAYQGEWALMAKGIWPDSEITLIEANKFCESKIKENGFTNYYIEVLGDENKEIDFNVCLTGCGEGNSIYKEQSVFPFDKVKRQMRRLDELLQGEFDFVKMDTQGSEKAIIEGGKNIIANAPLVQIETQVQEYNKNAPFVNDIINYMASLDYRILDITDFHYNSSNVLIQVDILFAKKSMQIFNLPCYS